MNGPEHYLEAQRLVDAAQRCEPPYTHLTYDGLISAAQVHATLAVAAATVLQTAHHYYEIAAEVDGWVQVEVVHDEDQGVDYGPVNPDEAMLGRPILDVHLPEPPTETADPADPVDADRQEWNVGDPEPFDVPELVDRVGDLWINLEPNAWYEQRTGPDYACSWTDALEYAPLRRPEAPTAGTLLTEATPESSPERTNA